MSVARGSGGVAEFPSGHTADLDVLAEFQDRILDEAIDRFGAVADVFLLQELFDVLWTHGSDLHGDFFTEFAEVSIA